jgi:repressor of nif and glnA expression
MHEDQRTQEVIRFIRLSLYNRGVNCGARVIRQHMQDLGEKHIPSVRDISRILSHHGLTHGRTGLYPGDIAQDGSVIL